MHTYYQLYQSKQKVSFREKIHVQMSRLRGNQRVQCMFFLLIPMSKIAAAPCAWLLRGILVMGWMAVFIVYFEPAGTSMLSVARAGFEGVVLPTAILFRLRTSACQEGIFFVVMWRRACLVRWSLRMNRRSHTGQTNFFSPVCVRRWRESSSERANLLSQPSQLQLKGFSPKRRKQRKREREKQEK